MDIIIVAGLAALVGLVLGFLIGVMIGIGLGACFGAPNVSDGPAPNYNHGRGK